MKLSEALALVEGTDRGIQRSDSMGGASSGWSDPVDMSFSMSDLSYDGWVVEPEAVVKSFTLADLKVAWENARSGMVSVKRAEDSRLFNNLKVELFG